MENCCYSKKDAISLSIDFYADVFCNCIMTHQLQDTPVNKIKQLFLKEITTGPECDPLSLHMSADAQPANR
jgi:hypothetical protein